MLVFHLWCKKGDRPAPRRSRFGASDRRGWGRAGGGGPPFLHPLVQAPPPGVHEEVANGGQLQAQLLGDGDLKVLGRPLVLVENGVEGPALDVREDQPVALGDVVAVNFALILLFSFAGWGGGGDGQVERTRGR